MQFVLVGSFLCFPSPLVIADHFQVEIINFLYFTIHILLRMCLGHTKQGQIVT